MHVEVKKHQMTKKQWEEIFTFPSGIDQLYVPRQDAVENGLYQLYESAGLQIPRVFYFKSPLALQMAINYLSHKAKNLELENDFMRAYPSFVNAILYDELNSRSRNNHLWQFVSGSVASKGAAYISKPDDAAIEIQRYNHISATIENALQDDLQKRLAIKGMQYLEVAGHPHFRDIAWLITQRKNVQKYNEQDRDLFLRYHDLVRNGLMHAILLDGVVLWCPLPTTLCLNDLKQFHCEDGPALHWNDDYGLYFWKGIKVRKRIIEFPESITRLDVIEEPNPEIRRCIKERMGIRKFASLFTLVEMDRDLDLGGNEQFLWRTSHIDDVNRDYLYFAEVTSPTTHERQFVEVPPGMSNVWEAVAWALGDEGASPRSTIEV